MKNILALVDLSEVSERLVALAGTLARGTHAKLWILHIAAPDPEFVGFDAGPQVVRDTRAKELRQEHRELQALRDAMKALGTDAEALLVQGPTVDTLFMEAARLHADLLVMGSHGRGGLYKALTGSVSGSALKRSTTPIVIVPPTERD
jgi:nucleotide-binding universal stress UspA family protein